MARHVGINQCFRKYLTIFRCHQVLPFSPQGRMWRLNKKNASHWNGAVNARFKLFLHFVISWRLVITRLLWTGCHWRGLHICFPWWILCQERRCLHKNLVAVNPFNKTGIVRELDKKTYRKLQRRFRNAVHVYKNNREQLIKTYRETRQYLTSEIFWRKYLNI